MGRHFGITIATRGIFLPVNCMENPKSQINIRMHTVRIRNNGNHFIEQYEWTISVCITVQIGELGKFTDVQIGERGKQRVKGEVSPNNSGFGEWKAILHTQKYFFFVANLGNPFKKMNYAKFWMSPSVDWTQICDTTRVQLCPTLAKGSKWQKWNIL